MRGAGGDEAQGRGRQAEGEGARQEFFCAQVSPSRYGTRVLISAIDICHWVYCLSSISSLERRWGAAFFCATERTSGRVGVGVVGGDVGEVEVCWGEKTPIKTYRGAINIQVRYTRMKTATVPGDA